MQVRSLWPFRPILRDYATIRAAFHAGGGGPGPWRTMQDWARHRSITVVTPADPAATPILLTCVRLNGDVHTQVDRTWLHTARGEQASALVERHFRAVTAALAGWPAVIALTRGASWVMGLTLGALSIEKLISASLQETLQFILSWPLWITVLPLALGACIRLILRAWIRRKVRLGAI